MKRRLFNALAAVSLLMFVATVVLWERSYRSSDWVEWVHERHFYAASTTRCGIALTYSYVTNAGDRPHLTLESLPAPDVYAIYLNQYDRTFWTELGFRYDSGLTILYVEADGSTTSAGRYRFQFPLYLVATLCALGPAVCAMRVWRRRVTRPGHCPICGYDLRASPERCPECGTIPPQAALGAGKAKAVAAALDER